MTNTKQGDGVITKEGIMNLQISANFLELLSFQLVQKEPKNLAKYFFVLVFHNANDKKLPI